MDLIPYNKPFLSGKETDYITESVKSGKISGNGIFTKRCQKYFETRYGFEKALLTTSCTDALEMAAILCDIKPGDEVIVPSYTFVSSALAFIRQGARIVFADSYPDNPNIDPSKIEALITKHTKVIVPVHYAGIACDMDAIMDIANRHAVLVVEDAAQAIDSYYKGKPLGSIGHLGCFSFHETKNLIAGEGGMLTINDKRFIRRSEIIWEKGTNRSEFFRGEVNKYGWVDTGSSFLPSELISAFLWAQIEHIDDIQKRRVDIWNKYNDGFAEIAKKNFVTLPVVPNYATINGHIFYLICRNITERSNLISYLKERGILAVFHYLSLHKSEFYISHPEYQPDDDLMIIGRELPYCDRFADCLVRLPLFFELTDEQIEYIISTVNQFYTS